MFKKWLCVCVCAAALAVVSAAAVQAVQKEAGVISVSSSLTKEVEPNIAELVLKVEISGDTAQIASDENKKIANAVIDAVKPLLVPGSKDYIKTSAFVVSPQYIYDKNKVRTINNYIATNSIEISTSNVQNVGKVIDAALGAGANRVGSLKLRIDSPNSYCVPMLEEASKDAFFKAGAVAKAIGKNIAGVKFVNTSCNIQNDVGLLYDGGIMAKTMVSAPVQSTPIEAGKVLIHANVNSEYYVK